MQHLTKCSFQLALVLATGLLNFTQLASAQNFQINQQGISSIPQYVPRYPLHTPAQSPVTTQQAPVMTQALPSTPAVSPTIPNSTPSRVFTPRPAKPVLRPAPTKTPPRSSAAKKKADAAKKAKEKKIPPHYGVDYSIYRDQSVYPIDPRKPNNSCVRPNGEGCCRGCGGGLPGVNGRPYKDLEPGGCTCQKKHPTKKPQFNLHWPRPFSAILDERDPVRASERYNPCQKKRFVDVFDHLSTIKISDYKRSDSGYSGIGSDPYGCLGESKQLNQYYQSQVYGVDYRFPSEPVQRGGLENIGQRFKQSVGQAVDRYVRNPSAYESAFY